MAETLVSALPVAGTILSQKPYRHGFTELTLSNGMKVYTKKTDFDIDYCKMVNDMTAADVQRMAQRILAAKRCIEVTMLSE